MFSFVEFQEVGAIQLMVRSWHSGNMGCLQIRLLPSIFC